MESEVDFESERRSARREVDKSSEWKTHQFLGKALLPFSFGRQAAVQRLAGDASSAMENVVLLLYVCTQTEEEIELGTRSLADKIAFRKKMYAWADTNKITIHRTSKVSQEAKRVSDEIWAEIEAADSNPIIPASAKGPTSPN